MQRRLEQSDSSSDESDMQDDSAKNIFQDDENEEVSYSIQTLLIHLIYEILR
jgi:hypothetical protein